MNEFKRLLVAVRATTDCLHLLGRAREIATGLSAELYFLDVIHNPFGAEGWNLPFPSLSGEYEAFVRGVRDEVRHIVEEERKRGSWIEGLVREGEPVEVITKVITEKKIDLLILPQYGENRFEHIIFGQDNEKIIRKMPCSILLLKEESGRAVC
jgi:universal stress protein A